MRYCNKKGLRGPHPPAGCVYRWIESWGWSLFSKSPFDQPMRKKKNEPLLGHVGHWRGRTAPPWQVGLAAPRRWPAKQPKERPPFLLKQAQAIASYFAVEELKLSNDRLSRERLRDLAAHIKEQARESGLAFAEKHSTRSEFARGIHYEETEGEPGYHEVKLRQFIDGARDDKGQLIPEYILKWEPNYDMFGGGWITIPLGTDSAIAAQAGFEFEEVDSVVEARRKKPLRWRKKPGRKPIGDKAMTDAERKRKQRANKKSKASDLSNGRRRSDVGPSPLGPALLRHPIR